MTKTLPELSNEERSLVSKAPLPSAPKPMLAVLADHSFSDPDWIFERKLDGERVLAVCNGTRTSLLSRNGKDVSRSYPELVGAMERLASTQRPPDGGAKKEGQRTEAGEEDGRKGESAFVVDGEVVAFSGSVTSFTRLQKRMQISDSDKARESRVAVFYYLFDLLHFGELDLTALPLRSRKRILQVAFSFEDPIRYTPHRNEEGVAYHQEACNKGWEGIIAKRAESPYEPRRSREWRKFKCVSRQELVIGGFTDPEGHRTGFGALLVGYYDEHRRLRYAGKVGTGFDEETLSSLTRLLKARRRKTPPFSREDLSALPNKKVHWVTPKLVGQFGFTEWTRTGKLRHPRFLGLRRDKDPEEVIREEADSGPAGS